MKLKLYFFSLTSIILNSSILYSCSNSFAIEESNIKDSYSKISSNTQSIQEKVDTIVKPNIESRKSVGIIVGIIQGNNKKFFSYGTIKKGQSIPPNEKTIFHIASVTKVLTNTLLADMIVNDSVKLTDGISKYLPELKHIPKFQGQEINLASLGTHTSGLPNIPTNLNIQENIKAPYGNYQIKDLYNFLSTAELKQDNNTHTGFGYYLYSNLGSGLLGHILSKKLNLTYEEAIKKRICNTLNLKDTVMTLSEEQKTRLAKGYFKYNNKEVEMPISGEKTTDALAGSFAFNSTADDLLTLVEANLGAKKSKLDSALKITQEDVYPNFHLGWDISQKTSKGYNIIWKNGGWTNTGFSSFIGFTKDNNTGIVILSNTIDTTLAGVTNLGISLLDVL